METPLTLNSKEQAETGSYMTHVVLLVIFVNSLYSEKLISHLCHLVSALVVLPTKAM